jgi:hypothetical protein
MGEPRAGSRPGATPEEDHTEMTDDPHHAATSEAEVEAQREAARRLAQRLDDAIMELREIARDAQTGDDLSWQGDPSLLVQSAGVLQTPQILLDVPVGDPPLPEWIVLVRIGGSDTEPEHVRLRQVWDETLNRPVFVDPPPGMEVILQEISRQIDRRDHTWQVQFPWIRFPAAAEELLLGMGRLT